MNGILRVGEWILDAEANELRRDDQRLRLEAKAIEVLRHLCATPGRVVPREELMNRVWPGVVVGDDALTQAIIKLRKALGDDAQEPRYIETIPKRGYRLIAPVAEEAVEATAPKAPAPRARRSLAFGVAAMSLALAGFGAYLLFQGRSAPWPLATDARERTPAGSFPLVAVLPFANLSGDPSRDYLSDGVTADIIDALGRFSGVRVMSWGAVQPFKAKEASPQALRESLQARYLVRGSVREAGGTLRVAVELSDAEKGVQLWSERYDAQGPQLFEVQDRIVRSVVGALAVRLTGIEQQRAAERPTQSAEAYDLVLRARALVHVNDRAANREARSLLARAAKMAPDYAEVWVLTGEAEWDRAAFGWIEDPEAGIRRAEELARRALALPDTRAHVRAHALLATLKTHTGHPEEALQHTERAIAMNPSDTSALFRHAHALLVVGRIDEAIATSENAMRYHPRPTLGAVGQLAMAYYLAGRYRDALAYVDMIHATGQVDSGTAGLHATRAAALAQLGELEEARKAAEIVRRRNPYFSVEESGTRLRRPEDAARLREGLAKAGL